MMNGVFYLACLLACCGMNNLIVSSTGMESSTDFMSTESTDMFSTYESNDETTTTQSTTESTTTQSTSSEPTTKTTTVGEPDDLFSVSDDAEGTTTEVASTTPTLWSSPIAWISAKLYPWGKDKGDLDLMDEPDDWRKYDRCKTIDLNGKAGALFFASRQYEIDICNNGVIGFDLGWRPSYPYLYGSNSWYNQRSFYAAHWGRADELIMDLIADDYPEAKTHVYYQTYTRSSNMDSKTSGMLNRAQLDVAASPESVADFVPTWVLVVTWINMAGDVGCRYPLIYDKLYKNSYWYQWYAYYYTSRIEACKEEVKTMPLNHFQAVFITDGVNSFIKYNYPEDGINWAYPGIGPSTPPEVYEYSYYLYGIAVGGYQAPVGVSTSATENLNLWNSGSLDFINIDERPGNMNDESVGEWLFRVEKFEGVADASVKCVQWAQEQDTEKFESYSAETPCPQNFFQAWRDRAFWFYSYKYRSHQCYQSSFATNGLRQRCCYDTDWWSWTYSSLITDPPLAGYVIDTANAAEEAEAYLNCCVYGTGVCQEFYKKRFPSDGTGYDPPTIRRWWGDPHIVTTDGFQYTFNGQGEYLFTKTGDNDTVIQARTERVDVNGTLGQATYFSAICIAVQGLPRVQIQLNKTPVGSGVVNTTQLIINGTFIDLSTIEQDANTSQTIDGVDSNILFDRSNISVTVLYSSGLSLEVTPANNMLALTLGLPNSMKGQTVGLTGKFDGDPENDLTFLNGTGHIPTTSTESFIFDWASTFAVSEEDSIMYYTDDTNWNTFNNNTFRPVFADDVDTWAWSSEDFKTRAYAACGNDTSCLYDTFITGDIDIGVSSKDLAEEGATITANLGNFAPQIYGPDILLVTDGTFEYTATVNDSNEDSISVSTSFTSVINRTGDMLVISGEITNTTNFAFQVSAKDTNNAASSKTVFTMFCNCVNNGTCINLTEQQIADAETFSVVLECECPTGYTGALCDSDLDACALVATPCYPSVPCVDTPAPADHLGYTCGDCPAGYTGDGKVCSDINECTGNVCGQICINSPGSFVCSCQSGYSLNTDGSTCDDVNECLTDPCHQVCNNTAGSYSCGCDSGFVIGNDGINCEPENPCNDPNPCDSTNGLCRTVNNSQVCSCKKGYMLGANGTSCEDINECATGANGCQQICNNTMGGYSCECQSGYTLSTDTTSCDDVNECSTLAAPCNASLSFICSNNKGGYSCVCPTGSQEVDGKCEVVLLTDPVPAAPSVPSPQAELNSVVFSLDGMTLDEYTVETEAKLFSTLASAATNYCNGTSSCSLTSLSSRRKRSTDVVLFYKEYFSRLPGYPLIDSNGHLQVAVYIIVPNVGVLAGLDLEQIVQEAKSDIETALDVAITGITVYTTTTPTMTTTTTQPPTTTSTEPSTEGPTESPPSSTIAIAVGVSVGLLVIAVIVIVIVIIKVKKRGKTGPSDEAGSTPAGSNSADAGRPSQ